MRRVLITAAVAAVLAGGTAVSSATTTTPTSFSVTATVLATCNAATAATLAFPNYTPGGGNQFGSTLVNVYCTNGTPFHVSLNAGGTGSMTNRIMLSGTNTLLYNLWTDGGYGTVFGDGTNSSATVAGSGAGIGTAVQVKVWGQLLDSLNLAAAPGSYTDSVQVTVIY